MRKNDSIFITLLFVIMFLLVSIAAFSLYLEQTRNVVLYKTTLNIILILAISMSVCVLTNTMMIIKLLRGKKISNLSRRWVKFSLGFIYTNVINLSVLLKLDKNKIRSVFSELNNRLVFMSSIIVQPRELLILLPHCLQRSSCPHKITGNVDNCKRCGACDVDRLIEIRDKYGVNLYVATGGTLARKIIKEVKPRAVIAVACERDLSSGILDVKKLPVIGVLNYRPEGPCVNTRVDIKKLEETIQYFIGEGE